MVDRKYQVKQSFIGIDGEITEVGSLENRDKGLETEDKARNEKGFIPPTPEEVRQYFSDKGYSEEAANKAYDYYSAEIGRIVRVSG